MWNRKFALDRDGVCISNLFLRVNWNCKCWRFKMHFICIKNVLRCLKTKHCSTNPIDNIAIYMNFHVICIQWQKLTTVQCNLAQLWQHAVALVWSVSLSPSISPEASLTEHNMFNTTGVSVVSKCDRCFRSRISFIGQVCVKKLDSAPAFDVVHSSKNRKIEKDGYKWGQDSWTKTGPNRDGCILDWTKQEERWVHGYCTCF